jgi:multidrug efflux pump subunit AcrA (membrane-fusion protein)
LRVKLLDYEDLTDSRELLNAGEPNFFAFLIYLLCLILVAAFVWSWFGEIDIVVKATGIVRTIDNVSLIRNINEGIVIDLNYQEGQRVQKGDLLYVTSNRFREIENESYLIQQRKISAEIEMLTKLEKSILDRKNCFRSDGTSLENEYYNRFGAFQNKYRQLKSNYEKAQIDWVNGKKLGVDLISKIELDRLERDYQYARLELDKYLNETIFNLKNQWQAKKDQLLQINDKLNEFTEYSQRSRVRAPISGVIQVIENFNQGDFMPEEIEVLRIVPDQEKANLKIELTIANKDIGLVKTGQQVKYRFLALPFKEYGTLEGKVKVVAVDITGVQNSALSYRVEGSVAKLTLSDKKGVPAEIKVGMLCDARIVVKRKKILYIVLEKLDFR